jgi:hypothetical protein
VRRYCVTFGDNWTPLRLFWTEGGMRRWLRRNDPSMLCAPRMWRWAQFQWIDLSR